ncbi:MAG: hypothetical protein PUE14_09205, partial [Clostridia bacterium]|nr:hypothetical protein [Clostridia bacterium]
RTERLRQSKAQSRKCQDPVCGVPSCGSFLSEKQQSKNDYITFSAFWETRPQACRHAHFAL